MFIPKSILSCSGSPILSQTTGARAHAPHSRLQDGPLGSVSALQPVPWEPARLPRRFSQIHSRPGQGARPRPSHSCPTAGRSLFLCSLIFG